MTLNDVDILKELQHREVYVIIDMIAIGNKCSEGDAVDIFEGLIDKYSIDDIVTELSYEIIGKQPDSKEVDTVDNNEKSYKDILIDFYNELQTYDNKLGLTEFLNMNTSFMYKYSEGVKSRYINVQNKKYKDDFESAEILAGAIFGKLKKPPKVTEDDFKTPKQRKEDRINEMRAKRGL
jgi:hypothetical protein